MYTLVCVNPLFVIHQSKVKASRDERTAHFLIHPKELGVIQAKKKKHQHYHVNHRRDNVP